MSLRRRLGYAVGGVGAAAVAAVATGVVVERKVVRTRAAVAAEADRYGEVHSPAIEVLCDDGLRLHAEVDEVSPYVGSDAASAGSMSEEPTVLFVHGFALNLDCWHFQRVWLRGKHRLAFYDQRSHGRSPRSDRARATIDQLGDDLVRVIETLAPSGPVVLVGHSMGGMTIMALADRHPEVFESRVAGVALIATTAGNLHPHNVLSQWIPDRLGTRLAPRVIAALAQAPELVDSARRPGSNIGYLVTSQFSFGGDVPPAEVEFLDSMLGQTSFEVLAEFLPTFSLHDKYAALEQLAQVPTIVVAGKKDRVTPISHSRKLAELIGGAKLIEYPHAGHMVIFESRKQVNTALEDLIKAATSPGDPPR